MVTPSSLQALASNNIDLWSIDPSKLSTQSVDSLNKLLSEGESESILCYKNKTAQHTALVTRAICRLILSQYTLTSPSALTFTRDKYGKPELKDNPQHLRFNLSHNNQQIIMAVCVNDDIGCDIENPSRKVSIEPITKRYFAAQEHESICNLQGTAQQQYFFKVWTLKEAFVKATGIGISLGLDTFYFDFDDSVTAEDTLNKGSLDAIKITFNDHYSLNKKAAWQFYQAHFNLELLAICRASHLNQKVTFLDAIELIN